ncbi:hypothetical protein [Bacillus pseudomycoides]|uniref:hypothetical protein n=1 Tax=Bacillus pseudomycoides TaxID=64104 RepID=UPI000BED14CE|nr:hypothetical protein [Bacillus pseudomycoides]PED09092.1 hypothetical protein COO19_06260 [Bacillus pseudomycoides]PEI97472.1 hypothetical protein CN686_08460 [Bacillus pseudomycoides]PEK29547.1 hypothetical protein CN693_01855 [Bacillus pseudomycoides]PEM71717.1 hypothetical protein CN619_18035 [Bacillus pseudomycoides]PEO23393.1 hypothetical protein CN542_01850 [Bacillus pseudomycoides]
MSTIQMAVPINQQHKYIKSTSRGDNMSQQEEYAATYEFGKTKVYVVAPEPKPKKEVDKILQGYYAAGWAIIKEMQAKENIEE